MTDICIALIIEGIGDKSEGEGSVITTNFWTNYVTFEQLQNLVIWPS
jgi:hypothetical protein